MTKQSFIIITISLAFTLEANAADLSTRLAQSIEQKTQQLQQVSLDRNNMVAAKKFVFDPKRLTWTAYDHYGNVVASGRASGGRGYCPDVKRRCRTPVGSFTIYAKRGANCVSSKYPLNPRQPRAKMPYCMFFHRGFAIHGSYHVPNYNASHGCIRVQPADARWLHSNFLDYGTRVIVKPYN